MSALTMMAEPFGNLAPLGATVWNSHLVALPPLLLLLLLLLQGITVTRFSHWATPPGLGGGEGQFVQCVPFRSTPKHSPLLACRMLPSPPTVQVCSAAEPSHRLTIASYRWVVALVL